MSEETDASLEPGIKTDLAGQLTGDAASLNAGEFWDFGPLTRARKKLGM